MSIVQSVSKSSRIVERFNAAFSYFSTDHILKMAPRRLCIPQYVPLTTQLAINRYKRRGDVCFCMFKSVIVFFHNGINVTQTCFVATTIGTLLIHKYKFDTSIGHNWEPSLILKNCHCRVRYFHQFLILSTLRNNYLEVNRVKLSITGVGWWKCLISAFQHFLHPLFQNDQGWPIIPSFSLLTWYIVIDKYVRL